MPQEFDELYSRRRERQQRQQARKQAQKRRGRLYIGLALLLVCLLVVVVLLVRSCSPENGSGHTQPPAVQQSQSSQTTQSTAPRPTEPETVITIAAAGDLNVTDQVVAAGDAAGRYDYTGVFMDVAALFARADVSVLNFEGNLCGSPYGTQSASAPQELIYALKNAGVDMVQLANSYTVSNGLTGLQTTLDAVRSAGLEPLGAFASKEEFDSTQGFTIRNIGGIRVAFVAFTKGVGSLGLPAGSQDMVNLLYKDYSSTYREVDTEGITAVLDAVAQQKPDVTVALLHWGSEYNNEISDSQNSIVELLQTKGVDAIIGTHPHYVQQVQYDAENGRVVAYSLGDFFGDAEKAGTNYSIVLQLEVTRNNQTGETKITGCSYEPIYILTPQADGVPLQVVRIREAMAMYENDHVTKVSQQTYENMKYALERIESRVEG